MKFCWHCLSHRLDFGAAGYLLALWMNGIETNPIIVVCCILFLIAGWWDFIQASFEGDDTP